jgi:hypothetical protein
VVPSDGERLATIEQVLKDVRDDIHDVREEQKEDHHRLRNVEEATTQLVGEHKRTQERRELEMRRLGVRIQWLTLVVALASFGAGIAIALLTH